MVSNQDKKQKTMLGVPYSDTSEFFMGLAGLFCLIGFWVLLFNFATMFPKPRYSRVSIEAVVILLISIPLSKMFLYPLNFSPSFAILLQSVVIFTNLLVKLHVNSLIGNSELFEINYYLSIVLEIISFLIFVPTKFFKKLFYNRK